MLLPGVPPGWRIEVSQLVSAREWCIRLTSEDKEFAESFCEGGPECLYTPGYVGKVFERLEAQAGIKFNWNLYGKTN
jgi:hypothetical protein